MQAGVDAFVVFEKRILLILRDDIVRIQNPNMWNLPGGGIEDGESEQEALVRELSEEIGVEPKNIQRLDKTVYEDGNVVTKYWIQLNSEDVNKLKLGEGQEMRFFTFDELFTLKIIPNLMNYISINKAHLLERLSSLS